MAAKTDISQTSILAGQQLEFWRLASNPNSHVNSKTFQAFLEGRSPFENFVTKVSQGLLTQIGNLITIPTTTERFVAAEKFVMNTKNGAELKINYLGDCFKNWFLEKAEELFIGSSLKVQKLSQNSVDQPILDELGGEAKAETTFTEMFEFLKTAPHAWYIFYIKDVNGRLRTEHARWDGGGWGLDACELHDRYEWDAYSHVVSRNSYFSST